MNDTDIDPVADLEAKVLPRLEDIEANIGIIVDILTAHPGGPWTWELLDDDAQDALFGQLSDFVGWLELRYLAVLSREDYPLPACWFQHGVAVELLTALMVARQSVYQASSTIASSALVEWHERCLWPTFRRLVELKVFNACDKARKHVDTTPRAPVNSREGLDEFLAARRLKGTQDAQSDSPPTSGSDLGATAVDSGV